MAKQDDQSQLVAILSYITIVGWVVALVLHLNNKTSLGGYHVRQTLLLYIIGVVLSFIPILNIFLWVVLFVFWIFGLVYAVQKQEKPMPLIGDLAQKWFKDL